MHGARPQAMFQITFETHKMRPRPFRQAILQDAVDVGQAATGPLQSCKGLRVGWGQPRKQPLSANKQRDTCIWIQKGQRAGKSRPECCRLVLYFWGWGGGGGIARCETFPMPKSIPLTTCNILPSD